MEFDPTTNTPIKTSKYNAAIAQLYRMDDLWQAAHKHSRSGELRKWNWDLDAIWRELAGDVEPEDAKKYYKISELFSLANKKQKRGIIYQVIEKKEIFLRRLQNKQGKGTAYADPDEELM